MQKMLAAAEQVLMRDGYHAFSTRRVAAECGVSLGHLTYYFPTKNTLLRAMITSVTARYVERIRGDAATRRTRSAADLQSFLSWLLRDTVTAETSGLFRELWVLAKHDAFIAREVLQLYENLMQSFVEVIAPLYPGADRNRLRQVAHLLGMLTAGGTVLFAGPGKRTVTFEEILPMAIGVVMDQLSAAAVAAPAAETVRRSHRTARG